MTDPESSVTPEETLKPARHIGKTLLVETLLSVALLLVSTVAYIALSARFAGEQRIFMSYRIAPEESFGPGRIKAIESGWRGPGMVRARIVDGAKASPDLACGERALELETTVQARMNEIPEHANAINAAAYAMGLGTACPGMQVHGQISAGPGNLIANGAVLLAPILLWLSWRSRRGRHWLIDWADWRPRVGLWAALGWGFGVACAQSLCAMAIVFIASQWSGFVESATSVSPSPSMQNGLAWVVPVGAIAAPIVEEYLFRAWTLERFRRVMPVWLALGLTSLGFGILHLSYGPIGVVAATVFGVLIGLVWLRTRSWLACAFGHGLYNGAIFLLLMFMPIS